ncbi:MAG: ferric reductase-like transmembrane domain-containing protein [Micropepsaceae bacterium]
MALWHDKRGNFSALRTVTLLALITPALFGAYYTLSDNWGPRAFNAVTHYSGLWAIRILAAAYLVTVLRRMGRWPRLIDIRRMIGVACFCYLVFHVSLYVVDQAYDIPTVISEIVLRIYLTIGFIAFSGVTALAITSNDYMVRRMGGMRWRKLHWLIHPIIILGAIHNFMQSKLDMFHPTVLSGIVFFAMAYRLAHWKLPRAAKTSRGELPLWMLAALGIFTGTATFLAEAVGFWIAYGVSPLMVLQLSLDLSAGIRPGWYVLIACAILITIAAIRQRPDLKSSTLAAA